MLEPDLEEKLHEIITSDEMWCKLDPIDGTPKLSSKVFSAVQRR